MRENQEKLSVFGYNRLCFKNVGLSAWVKYLQPQILIGFGIEKHVIGLIGALR